MRANLGSVGYNQGASLSTTPTIQSPVTDHLTVMRHRQDPTTCLE